MVVTMGQKAGLLGKEKNEDFGSGGVVSGPSLLETRLQCKTVLDVES